MISNSKISASLVVLLLCVVISLPLVVDAKNRQKAPKMLGALSDLGNFFSPQWAYRSAELSFMSVMNWKPSFVFYKLNKATKKITADIPNPPNTYYSFAWNGANRGEFAVLAGDSVGNVGLFVGKNGAIKRKLLEFRHGGEGVRFSKLSWLPDGKGIVYSKNGILFLVRTDRVTAERLIKSPLPYELCAESWGDFNPVYSSVFAFQLSVLGRDAIYVYDTLSGEIIKAVDEKGYSAFHPTWSPDGKKLAFLFNKRAGSSKGVWLGQQDTKDLGVGNKTSGLWCVFYSHVDKTFSKPVNLSGDLVIPRKSTTADFTPLSWREDSEYMFFAGSKAGEPALYSSHVTTGKFIKLKIGDNVMAKDGGEVTEWRFKVTSSDLSSSMFIKGHLAFSGEVNLGEAVSRVIIKNLEDN